MFIRKDSVPDSPTTSMIKNIKKPSLQILEDRYMKRMLAENTNSVSFDPKTKYNK